MRSRPAALGIALSAASLTLGCPGQRRPPPRATPASATPSPKAPSPGATPTPTPSPLTPEERAAAWEGAVQALLAERERLTPQDLPRVSRLNAEGDALVNAREDLLERLEVPLLELAALRAELVEASRKAGQ